MISTLFKNKFISYIILVTFTMAFFMAPKVTYAAAGDGLLVYAQTNITTPRYRTYTAGSPGSFSAEASAQAANTQIQYVAMKTKPGATERIMGTLSTAASNNLTIQRWNGSSWVSPVEWQVTSNVYNFRIFDIIYENLSGKALVVYSGDSANPTRVYFRYWDGSSWSSPANFTFTTDIQTIRWIGLASKLNSNEIAVVAVGDTTSVNARIWDPSSNSFPASTESGLLGQVGSSAYAAFDTAYETQSGDLMVAWGSGPQSPYWNYATRVGSTWNIVTNPPALGGRTNDLTLAASPLGTSNRIALAAMDTLDDLSAARWDGSSWTVQADIDQSAYETAQSHNADVAFAGTTDNAIIVYADSTDNTNVDWARSLGGGAFSIETDYTPGGTIAVETIINLTADANSSKAMLIRQQIGDTRAHVYDESRYGQSDQWGTPSGDDPLENDPPSNYFEFFAFAWESVFNIPTLGVALTIVVISSFIAIMVKRRVILLKPSPA